MTPRRLYILHKLPTPYNDDFFRALHADGELDVQVFHLWRGSERRPWKTELGTGYPNYYMSPRLGLDWRTLRTALVDKESLFMVGDWAHVPTVALLLARIARGAPVTLWTDTPQEHLKRPFLKRHLRSAFLRVLLPRMDAIFASGEPARRVLMKMGAPSDRIVDLQFTVDLDKPARALGDSSVVEAARALRASVGCDPERLLFGMSGTVDFAKKAQDVGLRAFVEAHRQNPKMGLLVAGAGPELEALRALVTEFGVGDSVNLLGWQEPHQMDAFYAAIDVLFHPATYDPFPLVVPEALSWSIPVVGTITSGTVEQKVRDGENGFAVRPGDVDGMATALLRFADGTLDLETARKAARRAAEEWPVSRLVHIVKQECERLV